MPVNEQAGKPKSGRGKIIIIVLAVLLILLCCCLAVAAAIIGFDPFNWNLIDRLMGTYDPIASTLPSDTNFYMQVDLLKLDSEETANILDAFLDASDSDMHDKDDLLEKLDEEMESENGMTFTEDIKPWLGQYIGIAFIDFEVDIWGEPTDESVLVIAETIDTELADTYILGLIDHYRGDGWEFEDQDYEGVTIFESEDNEIAIARRDQLIYLSTHAEVIEDALDVTKDDSLAKNPTYQDAIAALPGDRLMTVYVGSDFFDAVQTMMESADYMEQPAGDFFETYRSLSMALTVVEQGIQFDTVTNYDPNQLSEQQLSMMTSPEDLREMAVYFPEDTYALMAGKHLDLIWEAYREQVLENADEDEFNAAMEEIEQSIGLNIDTELFPYLDGSWALGLYQSNQGVLAEDSDLPIGVMMLIGSSSISELQTTTGKVADALVSDQSYEIEEVSEQGLSLYQVIDPWYEDSPVFVFGTGQSYLLLGTDTDILKAAFGSGSSLGTAAHFNEVWAPFAENMVPVMYLDVTGLLDLYEASDPWDDVSYLEPLETVVMANSFLEGEQVHSQMLFFIDTD